MESELSPDKEKGIPPVPIKTYQWEDLKRAREAGGYPWTHLLKPPIEGEITAADIIRETTPRRSMSREFSKSRTHSPVDSKMQQILNLDSSPGSSRKHSEEGEDQGVHIPNFSKEVSLDYEDDALSLTKNKLITKRPDSQASGRLVTPVEIPKNVSPKGILKRRVPENFIGVTETREKTKCCHPLVNKIKYLADKTLHKLEKNENEKSPVSKRKRNEQNQEIRQLRSSPGAARRQKFSVIKLGDSDEMSKTLSLETPPPQKKDHIYEDIEEQKSQEAEKNLHFSPKVESIRLENDRDESKSDNKENESLLEKKSIASQDPSLVIDENSSLKSQEHVMEKLHTKINEIKNFVTTVEDEIDSEEPNVDEIFQNQIEEARKNGSPNITITEMTDDDGDSPIEQNISIPYTTSPTPSPCNEGKKIVFEERQWSRPSRRWTSEGGTPLVKPLRPTREGSVQLNTPDVRCACQYFQCDSLLPKRVNPVSTRPTSRSSNLMSTESDHEYEIIEKPPPNIIYTAPSVDDKGTMVKTDDELSSTTSLERKYLHHTSDEDDQIDDIDNLHQDKNKVFMNAQALQKDIEDRFFINTPSTVSRTECEISTSQVDSSALENLPLKRDSRVKNNENVEGKIQKRIKEGTGKLKTQAGKLKTKLQNIKTKQFSLPDRTKINFPERAKFRMPERFTLPDKRKFSLPDRPKFKNINLSEKLALGDRMKFNFHERPKFNIPEFPKIKLPERTKINFSSLGRKKEYKVETDATESSTDLRNVATVDFEVKTYPRIFNRKKKSELPKTSSSPTLYRDDTPPPTFTFTKVKKIKSEVSPYIPAMPEQPREYGNIENDSDVTTNNNKKNFDGRYDFDRIAIEYMEESESPYSEENQNTSSVPDVSPSKQEYTHVINEINNDEFFVRPRGISRENIQVREYLSDEIRQAFKIPKNSLALMGSDPDINRNTYINDLEADPEIMIDDEQIRYTEDVNERDDGYYTFPPVRPSRAKRKKKESRDTEHHEEYINSSAQFSEIDLEPDYNAEEHFQFADEDITEVEDKKKQTDFVNSSDLHAIHEYANDDVIEYPESIPLESQTLPMPPQRKKKFDKKTCKHSSLNDFKNIPCTERLAELEAQEKDIVVYRTEHEYIVPEMEAVVTKQSPVAPRRTRSKSSRCTSICDDDRTSHGAESLTLDTHILPAEEIIVREIRQESPGYAVVDKSHFAHEKAVRRSKSKTPPVRRRKSNSSERKYYTVGSHKKNTPDRPPRKKSSTSLITLNSSTKKSSGDLTQYVEIDEHHNEEVLKNLISGEVVSKMKDRPLPPPPRPPRGSRRKGKGSSQSSRAEGKITVGTYREECDSMPELCRNYPPQDLCFTELPQETHNEKVEEIEVSTQTDPLPDDMDFELGMDENFDLSMNSLRDLVDDESLSKSISKLAERAHMSRPMSTSEKSVKLSDPKMSELSKSTLGRTSPTVILVERRVSSPTRINERDEMLTEASLTVQHIDMEESQIPVVPPLPRSRKISSGTTAPKNLVEACDERALEKVTDANRDIQLDNLITQRLQVRDLDVGRLNVSELQASKILVSDIEGMTLQVKELDSKSGHLSVSGIEFSQSIIDEIVKKFAEISTSNTSTHPHDTECSRPENREEHTQTEIISECKENPTITPSIGDMQTTPTTVTIEEADPPQRPPPPDLTPLLYSYLQDLSVPSTNFFQARLRDLASERHDHVQAPPPPARRAKRKQPTPITESSSDEANLHQHRPSPRRMPGPIKTHEPTIAEAGAQFLRVCHNSISRTIRNLFNSFMSYISGNEDKKDVQMALVIFLVLIAGLIMFGLSDSRAIHHHHWEFFNPPDGKE